MDEVPLKITAIPVETLANRMRIDKTMSTLVLMRHKNRKCVRKQWTQREAYMLRASNHKNVVFYYGHYFTAGNKYMLLEYLEYGNLLKWCYKENNEEECTDSQAIFILKQLTNVVSYLHSIGIIHRDIKLENIGISDLLTSTETEETFPLIKLFDFEHSCLVGEWQQKQLICGTIPYVGPEVIEGKTDVYSDIYALGAVAFGLITMTEYYVFDFIPFEEPQKETNDGEILQYALFNDDDFFVYWGCKKEHHPAALSFLRKCLNPDPKCRATASQLRRDRWLKKVNHKPYPTNSPVIDAKARFIHEHKNLLRCSV